jgi:hypothetical protein
MPPPPKPPKAGPLGSLLAAAGLIVGLGLALAQEGEPVALELVLALDSSSSVSAEEFDLQRRGAIAELGEPGLAVAVLQWSGGRMQRLAVEWTRITGAAGGQDIDPPPWRPPRAS